MSTPPCVLRDALFIRRKLGVRYIRINSLCIVGDGVDDWGEQLRRASSQKVYAGDLS